MPPPARSFRLLLLPGVLVLVAGLLSGLYRSGWPVVPTAWASNTVWHGALMIPAFFGAVISLERAVAFGRRWLFLAPLLSGCGGLVLLAGGPPELGAGLTTLAAALLFAAGLLMIRLHAETFTCVLALGTLCWLAGGVYWLVAGNGFGLVPAWLSFIILTIAGERLELTRFLATPGWAKRAFSLIVAVLILGLVLCMLDPALGLPCHSAGLLALALWLARYDIARRNLGMEGLTRFIGVCLMGGYFFLAIGGLFGLAGGLMPGHRWYDAALHSVTLGFIFSMVLGHALIVLPAVARIRVPFGRIFYAPLAFLYLSLILRIAGGLFGSGELVRAGTLGNVLALALFVGTVIVRAAKRSSKR